MRKVVLYIAMSLDGYIADQNGKIEWLKGHSDNEENIDTYSAFIKNVDSVVMGWNTYHQIITELSPNEWVYKDLTSYILTHRPLPSEKNIKFVHDNPCGIVEKLKTEHGKTIWICGGGNIIQPLIQNGLIDEYYISIIPTLLGNGIRLFEKFPKEMPLKLIRSQICNGITELVYRCR